MSKTLPETVSEIYSLLEPLSSEDRQKVFLSAMTLLGEEAKEAKKHAVNDEPEKSDDTRFGPKASRWMAQNNIGLQHLEEIFHIEGSAIEVIAGDIPGNSKRIKTENCYLVSGVRSFLVNDEAKFSEDEVIDLCKQMGCYDSANHYKTRKGLGNNVAGTKATGFTLPAPGLRAAAGLLLEMSNSS